MAAGKSEKRDQNSEFRIPPDPTGAGAKEVPNDLPCKSYLMSGNGFSRTMFA